jgi:FkbM family methyltransferase
MIKKLINKSLNILGYNISKLPSLENKINKGEYKWLQEFGIRTVIDVGANDGGFALLINKILPDAFIYSFEPINSCFIELQKNTSSIKNIKYFNYALGDKEEEKIFYQNEFSPSSSFLQVQQKHVEAFPFTANTKSINVLVEKLDNLNSSINFNKKVLLKIDVQGFELNVLKGAQNVLKKIDMIFCEISFAELYKDQPAFGEILEYLENYNFKYFGNFEQLADPLSNKILQADAIFIKSEE